MLTLIFPDGCLSDSKQSLVHDADLWHYFLISTAKSCIHHVLHLPLKPKHAIIHLVEHCSWGMGQEGRAFKSPSFAKVFLLGAVKYANRDAYCMRIEDRVAVSRQCYEWIGRMSCVCPKLEQTGMNFYIRGDSRQ